MKYIRILKSTLVNPFNPKEQKASYETMRYILNKGLATQATKALKSDGLDGLKEYLFKAIPSDYTRDFHREEIDFEKISELLLKENLI